MNDGWVLGRGVQDLCRRRDRNLLLAPAAPAPPASAGNGLAERTEAGAPGAARRTQCQFALTAGDQCLICMHLPPCPPPPLSRKHTTCMQRPHTRPAPPATHPRWPGTRPPAPCAAAPRSGLPAAAKRRRPPGCAPRTPALLARRGGGEVSKETRPPEYAPRNPALRARRKGGGLEGWSRYGAG